MGVVCTFMWGNVEFWHFYGYLKDLLAEFDKFWDILRFNRISGVFKGVAWSNSLGEQKQLNVSPIKDL